MRTQNLLSEATIKYTLLLTLVTRLYVISPGLVYLITESVYFWPPSPISALPHTLFSVSVSHDFVFYFYFLKIFYWSIVVAQTVKRLSTMRETWVRSLGREDSLEKEMATHSSTLAYKIPWTEEPGVPGVAKSRTRLSDFTHSLIVALRCCVSFYCRAKWISHMYIPSF